MSIEHVEIGEIVAEPTLEDLAVTINQEHKLTQRDLGSATQHAVACGLALLEVQRRVPLGQWEAWKTSHLDMPNSTAADYMRLAEFRHLIGPGDSTRKAKRTITALAPVARPRGRSGRSIYDAEFVGSIRRLRDQGVSVAKIAELLQCSKSTIRWWSEPSFKEYHEEHNRKRRLRQRAAKAALQRQQRDAAVKTHGGPPAEAYSLIRRCLQILDRELADAEGQEERGAWRSALAAAHQVEDGIVKALKLEATR